MATPNADEVRADLEKQVAELKDQVSKLSDRFAERASEAADTASDVVDDVRKRTRGAARQVRHQAHVVSDAIWENPGTAATVLSSAGFLGALIGFAIGYGCGTNSRRW